MSLMLRVTNFKRYKEIWGINTSLVRWLLTGAECKKDFWLVFFLRKSNVEGSPLAIFFQGTSVEDQITMRNWLYGVKPQKYFKRNLLGYKSSSDVCHPSCLPNNYKPFFQCPKLCKRQGAVRITWSTLRRTTCPCGQDS